MQVEVLSQVDGTELPAHRAVLAAHSQYFYTMFTCGMAESRTEVSSWNPDTPADYGWVRRPTATLCFALAGCQHKLRFTYNNHCSEPKTGNMSQRDDPRNIVLWSSETHHRHTGYRGSQYFHLQSVKLQRSASFPCNLSSNMCFKCLQMKTWAPSGAGVFH